MAITEMTPTRTESRLRGLGTFIALTFLLSWGVIALFVVAPDLTGEAGLTNPLFLLAVYSPGIAGVAVAWRQLGRAGMPGFFRRLTMFRMPAPAWWLVVAGMPAIVYAGALLSGTAGDSPVFSPWYSAIPTVLAALFLAGTNEEFGWRGVALPVLQRRFTPLVSGLLVGLVWSFWHLPAFALSGTEQSAWAVAPAMAGIVALSVIMTWIFNVSRGSIAIAWLVHFQAMNPLFPDAQPWDNLFYIIAAVAVVIVNRRMMLGHDESVTSLQHPAER